MLSREYLIMSSKNHSPQQTLLSMDDLFRKKKIIPYLNDKIDDHIPVLSQAAMVFVQVDELSQLSEAIKPFREEQLKDVILLIHLDLVRGLAHDDAALRYIASLGRVNGISTVHHHLVAPARRLGLISTIRLFLKDSRSIERGISVIEKAQPNAVELLPCVAAIEVADRFRRLHIPRIASGLINNLNTVQRALDSGCCAASTSNRELWAFNAEL